MGTSKVWVTLMIGPNHDVDQHILPSTGQGYKHRAPTYDGEDESINSQDGPDRGSSLSSGLRGLEKMGEGMSVQIMKERIASAQTAKMGLEAVIFRMCFLACRQLVDEHHSSGTAKPSHQRSPSLRSRSRSHGKTCHTKASLRS